MKRAKTAPPEELLAAYADGGVNDDERTVVEQYLAENPRAREELEAIRELVARTREAVPRPVEEPEWSQMARRIIAMCEREKTEPRTAWQRAGEWLASALRPRNAALLGAAVVAAVVMFAIGRGGDSPVRPDAQPVARPQAQLDSRPAVDWNAVDEILADSADDGNGAAPDGDGTDDDIDIDSDADAALEYAVGGGLELFAEPDYEAWLDDLSVEELDALDTLLRDAQAG